jgi:hypothetical protein
MEVGRALELINKHIKCPDCGNGFIGNELGGLCIDDDTFKRWCKCGWRVEYHESDGTRQDD